MKIAVSSEGQELNSKVANRLGLAPYLIIVDLETMEHKAVENPGHAGTGGMQAVVLAIKENVQVVLTGYCSPVAEAYLKKNGIRIVRGAKGTVKNTVDEYARRHKAPKNLSGHFSITDNTREKVAEAMTRTARQFGKMLPILIGVIFLMGLFKAFVSKKMLLSVFFGNVIWDTVKGASLGSILPGNPINSYIIGGQMLENEVSLFAVTAFMMTWVSVGLVQLPAEMAALGRRFSLIRNAVSLVVSIGAAIVTVFIFNLIR